MLRVGFLWVLGCGLGGMAATAADVPTAAEGAGKTPLEYARDLESTDPKVRREAAYQLSRPGVAAKVAIPQLIRALEDDQQQVWFGAISALANLKGDAEPALPALLAELEAWQPFRKDRQGAQALYRTALALGSIGAPAVPSLSNALQSGKWHVRAGAARALAFAGPVAGPVAPRLVSGLADERAEVREAVAETLATLGAVSVEPLKEAFARVDEPPVKATTAMALGRLGPVAAPAAALLRNAVQEEKDSEVRVRALQAYVRVASDTREKVPLVLRCWDDADPAVRRAAHSALLLERPVETALLPEILPQLDSPEPAVRARAAGLIGELGPDAASAEGVVRAALARSVATGRPEPELFAAFAALGPVALASVFEALEKVPVDALKPDDWTLEVLRRMNLSVLSGLIGALDHPSAAVRAGVLEALTALGDRARAAAKRLPPALEDREGAVRLRAWVAAGACGVAPEVLMGRLESGLNDPIPAVRRSVVLGLARLGKLARPAVPKLVEALGSGDAALELASVRALAAMGSEGAAAASALVAKAGSSSPDVQAEILAALGAIGSGAASEMGPIWGLGDSSHRRVRLAFLEAVVSLQAGAKPAMPSVDRGLTDTDPEIRAAAVRARVAVDVESEDAVRAAVRGLDDTDGRVRRAAAAALGSLEERGRPGEERLFALLADADDRVAATDALRAIHPTSVPSLTTVLEHGDWRVREMAADALARLGKGAAEALAPLEKRVRDDGSEEVKRAARRALRRIREG